MNILRVIGTAMIGGGLFLLTGGVVEGAVLAGDSAAIPGYYGSQAFNGSVGSLAYHADVEFAVYAPGSYAASSALNFPTDPSGGQQYVYAYEISNIGLSTDRTVGLLSVGFDGDQQTTSVGVISGAAWGVNPSSSSFIPALAPYTSANWTFSPELTNGQGSNILVFTSPNGPHFYNASVRGGGLVDQQLLPSPIPEPASVMVIAGMVLLAGTGRRRHI